MDEANENERPENRFGENNEFDLGAIKKSYGFDEDGIHISEKPEASYTPSSAVQPKKPSGGTSSVAKTLRVSGHVETDESGRGGSASVADGLGEVGMYSVVKNMKVSKPFMSGSTPPSLSQRYLMWNSHGIIRSFKSEGDSSVEISFHDATIHPEIILDNSATNFTMADLNTSIVALASRSNSDRQSELLVRHISAWDIGSREWSIAMSDGERIECLSVGGEFIVVATNAKFLRLFTPAGAQRAVISLSGPIVTMCASNDQLAVARHTGGVVITADEEYEHQLYVDLYAVRPLSSNCDYPIKLKKSIPLALGPDCRLWWMSFSSSGRLVTMDSDGTLRLFSSVNSVWIPILLGAELLKDPLVDFIWPVGVVEKPTPHLRYVYCKGGRYPPARKNPTPATLDWRLPLIGPETEKYKIEGDMVLQELMMSEYNTELSAEVARLSQSYLGSLIKLFAVSCKAGRECRAAELAHLTSTSQAVQIMCNYAEKNQRPNLSERVAEIGRSKMAAMDQTDTVFCHSSVPSTPTTSVFRCRSSEKDVNGRDMIAPSSTKITPKRTSLVGARTQRKQMSNAESTEDVMVIELEDEKNPSSALQSGQSDSPRSGGIGGNPFKRNKLAVDTGETLKEKGSGSGRDFFDSFSVRHAK